MTTRCTIKNESDSNPAQELVVVAQNVSGPGGNLKVLKHGETGEWWVSSMSSLVVTERQSS